MPVFWFPLAFLFFIFGSYIILIPQLLIKMLQQWIDLARSTGLQTQKSIQASKESMEALEESTVESKATEEESIDKVDNQ